MRNRFLTTACMGLLLVACAAEEETNAPEVNTDPNPEEEIAEIGDIPLTLQEALGDFGKCMTVEVWVKTGIYKLYNAEVEGGSACEACHSDATAGAPLSSDVLWMFEEHQKFPAIMRLVTGTVDERGDFKDLVAANRYADKGVGTCPEGYACHPQFTLPGSLQQSIVEFVDVTLDRWHNGDCYAPYAPGED
jgi:hypothetical protein